MAQATSPQPDECAVTVFDADPKAMALAPWPPFPEDEIIGGNPNGHKGALLYRDPQQLYSVGVWECPPAKFEVPYAGTEMGHVLMGTATITDTVTGEARRLKPGDHFFIAFGAKVIWEVHETFRKVYTMYEAERDAERFY